MKGRDVENLAGVQPLSTHILFISLIHCTNFTYLILVTVNICLIFGSGTGLILVLVLLFFELLGDALQKASGYVISNRIRVTFGLIVRQVNADRLVEWDF